MVNRFFGIWNNSLLTSSTSVQFQPQGMTASVIRWINPQKARDDRRIQFLLDNGVLVCVTPELLRMEKKVISKSFSARQGSVKQLWFKIVFPWCATVSRCYIIVQPITNDIELSIFVPANTSLEQPIQTAAHSKCPWHKAADRFGVDVKAHSAAPWQLNEVPTSTLLHCTVTGKAQTNMYEVGEYSPHLHVWLPVFPITAVVQEKLICPPDCSWMSLSRYGRDLRHTGQLHLQPLALARGIPPPAAA